MELNIGKNVGMAKLKWQAFLRSGDLDIMQLDYAWARYCYSRIF
jgi:hypothetical protein